jgi:hypothetical protein
MTPQFKSKLKKQRLNSDQLTELNAFLNQYFPEEMRVAAIQEAKSTGKLSPEILAKVGIVNPSTLGFVQGQVERITGGKPAEEDYTSTELKRELSGADILTGKAGKPIDEASLTDEELSRRRDLFETLGSTGESIGGYSSQIKEAIERKVEAYGIPGEMGKDVSKALTEIVSQKGYYPQADELRQALKEYSDAHKNEMGAGGRLSSLGTLAERFAPLTNFINDQDARNELSGLFNNIQKAPDTSEDVRRLDELLGTRKETVAREGEIDKFITGIPGELEGPRNERIKQLRDLGGRQFEAQAPGLLAREAALGRYHSGAAGDVLANAYGDIEQNVESEAARLKSGDDDFYFNAAYQNQIRKIMEGRATAGASQGFERENIRGQQEQRFQQGQFDINANLQNDLLMQKYENQLQSAQKARQRQQDLQSRANRAGTAGALGGIGGTALGAGLGAAFAVPTGGLSVAAGAGLGAGIGGGVGSGLPLLFGSR